MNDDVVAVIIIYSCFHPVQQLAELKHVRGEMKSGGDGWMPV
jgi:hypothetical protein